VSTETTNLSLNKPDLTDNADIAIINANMDLIDAAMSFRAASVSDVIITGTAEQTIATFTPAEKRNFEIRVYLRVVSGATNVKLSATYDDGTGLQTKTLLYNHGGLYFPNPSGDQPYATGSYSLQPLFINATTAASITVKITASVANQVYASCAIVGV
jgi:hypothetical protein